MSESDSLPPFNWPEIVSWKKKWLALSSVIRQASDDYYCYPVRVCVILLVTYTRLASCYTHLALQRVSKQPSWFTSQKSAWLGMKIEPLLIGSRKKAEELGGKRGYETLCTQQIKI
jgi:hypothetical protein